MKLTPAKKLGGLFHCRCKSFVGHGFGLSVACGPHFRLFSVSESGHSVLVTPLHMLGPQRVQTHVAGTPAVRDGWVAMLGVAGSAAACPPAPAARGGGYGGASPAPSADVSP